MQWFYVSDRQERIPVPEGQLAALAASGILRPTTLLWRRGLDSWLSAGEVKPEIFRLPDPAAEASGHAAPVESHGLMLELARTLRRYAAWLQISGGAYFACGVACTATAAVLGYFHVMRPERLAEWRRSMPELLHPLLDHPWTGVAGLALVALLLLSTGGLLIAGAARANRANVLQSHDDLLHAMSAIGRFFQISVFSLIVGAGVLAGVVAYRYQTQNAGPSTPIPPPPPKERVSV